MRNVLGIALLVSVLGCDREPPTMSPAASLAPVPSASSGLGVASASASAELAEPAPPAALLAEGEGCELEALTSYRIDQAFDDLNGTFTGELQLRLFNPAEERITELPILLHPNVSKELGASDHPAWMEIESARGADGTALDVRVERPTLVWVKLAGSAAPKAAIELSLRYRGKLRRLADDANDLFSQALGSMGSLSGAGAPDYGLLAIGDGILTAASAYPMVAPHRDGAFDTGPPSSIGDLAYNQVARFEVRTVADSAIEVVTNLVDTAAASRDGDLSLTLSKGACVRDFVLVGGRDLERSEEKVGGTRVSSIYRKRDAAGGKRALEAAVSSLRSFERAFGDYPYRELDVAEASLVGGAGGVEFSAMVLVAGMLYQPMEKSLGPFGGLLGQMGGERGGAFKQLDTMLEFTVYHEVAHQYFAGLVGNDARLHPSLDEPLAQYAAGLAFADRHGTEAAEEAMTANVKLNYAAYRMLGGSDDRVLRPTSSYGSNLEYAALVYGKAPYLYVALRDAVGAKALHAAIRGAIARHRFQLVTTEQWIAALERELGPHGGEVRPTFTRWLEEKHADADLGVDDSGELVLGALFSKEMVEQIKQGLALLGMTPKALMNDAMK